MFSYLFAGREEERQMMHWFGVRIIISFTAWSVMNPGLLLSLLSVRSL